MTTPDGGRTAAELRELAQRIQRLTPDRRDPERYHADKSEIEAKLRRLAADIERRDA
jgi:hypothetical protein